MFRDFIGLCAGMLAMFVAITLIEALDVKLYPMQAGLDPNNPAQLAAIVAALPMAAKLLIVAGWCLGAFVGAAVAARIAEHRVIVAMIIGVLVVAGTLMNAREIPHPQWMILAGTLLPLPLAWLATRLLPAHVPEPSTTKRWQGNEHER
jgi:alpha/beta superfamily hydrolase